MNEQKTVSILNMGCRLNSAEAATISDGFTSRGYQIVDFGEAADVVFLNTCTVTDKADSSCRNMIRKARKSSPNGKIIVAGCYAQANGEEIAEKLEVEMVLGNSEKHKVFDYLESDEVVVSVNECTDFVSARTTTSGSKTRSFLKIQDGCNYFCSYCIIPYVRGRSRAISIKDAIKEANSLIADGFKEIVLTGVNIGEYERVTGERLEDLVRELGKVEGLKRLRLSSIEPNTITDELLSILKEMDAFVPHFHLPLQSGDDEILKKMRRRYTTAEFKETIERIQKVFPDVVIGTDVIVGFPGETQEHFESTKAFLESLPSAMYHVFPYSMRKGTKASELEQTVSKAEKKERVQILTELGKAKLENVAKSFIGKESEVLFEKPNKEGYFEGHNEQFFSVVLNDKTEELKNEIKKVRLLDFVNEQFIAELI